MVAAIRDGRLEGIDPHHCGEHVEGHFSVDAMISGYEAAFERILADTVECEPSPGGAISGNPAR